MAEPIKFLSQEMLYINEQRFLDSNYARRVTDYKLFRGHSFCIFINPADTYEKGYFGQPYFKLYNADSATRDCGVVRFGIKAPHIYYHEKQPGLIINTRLLEDLNLALKCNIVCNGYVGTVFKCMNDFISDLARTSGHKYEPTLEPVDYRPAIADYIPNKNGKDRRLC